MAGSAVEDRTIAAADEVGIVEENELTRFERADEYMQLLDDLLVRRADGPSSAPSRSEAILAGLAAILDEYQEQSYLLDPYLERMVTPPIEVLQAHIRGLESLDADVVVRLSRLVYLYTKIRGYKAITNFFPHEVADLAPTLTYLEKLADPDQAAVGRDGEASVLNTCWELRYVLLLWLSLVCMIPFDLRQFDARSGDLGVLGLAGSGAMPTANRIEHVGRSFLSSPGKERDAAAVMLGRLFQRQDVQDAQFEDFAAFCSATLVSKPSAFLATGVLQALCEVVKTNDPAFVSGRLHSIQAVLDLYDDPDRRDLAGNGLVVKNQTKLTCRLGLKLLRPRKRRRFIHVRTLGASNDTASANDEADEDDDEDDVPDLIDQYISKLIESLQHKDTVVRYSAAKGLARLCERLPRPFIAQVTDAIVSLFHINIPDLYEGANDLNAVSECTWQGACMALAEQARRGLLFASSLGEVLEWVGKALLFDVRRGAHSVGANVRDSACYVVWALARAHDAEAIRPHALLLARKLVAVATLDRDVSIRRAASAAFQECVGRLDLFPHGIDVIRITDFYAVSVRKSAFLRCAVEVAEFDEYRSFLVDHLICVTIAHWDAAMRRLGAQAIARIVGIDVEKLGAPIVGRLIGAICASRDDASTHEALAALLLSTIDDLAASRLKRTATAQVLEASCRLVASAFDLFARTMTEPKHFSKADSWTTVVYLSLQDPDETVHGAASLAVRNASKGWKAFSVAQQQSNALVLGSYDYTRHADRFETALDHLMAIVDVKNAKTPASRYSSNVESRRNAYIALVRAIESVEGQCESGNAILRPSFLQAIMVTLLSGLEDYSTDQRGDVGSWIRLACLSGLSRLLSLFRGRHRRDSTTIAERDEYVTLELYDQVVGGIMKQTVERIDHVREVAGGCLLQLWNDERSATERQSWWRMKGGQVVKEAFIDQDGSMIDFKNANKLFPQAVKLLLIPRYRGQGEGEAYTLYDLFEDLALLLKRSLTKNNIVVPALELLRGIVEGGLLEEALEHVDTEGTRKWETILTTLQRTSTHALSTLKSHQRINASILFSFSLLPPSLAPCFAPHHRLGTVILDRHLKTFLSVPYPTIRARAAEYLYTLLNVHDLLPIAEEDEDEGEGKGAEEVEGVLTETRWATASTATYTLAAEVVVRELKRLLLPTAEEAVAP
ncbi:related to Tubulin-folding cofactor D [Pseudozyma flocculosa]|uniref:Related to Tubulin-folding cofactor D n=1 Tax=Pseudozyma flocculosa TaxID=84751 RepID=A0A5C3F7H6_9BASI|nr:related to Tubulin-folding cofactor D [Pseudozyma flocculosa]